MKNITRAVWTLSIISLFTDMASEMLYPILPIYLKHIGFSVLLIGILEGFAEAIAGLSKGYFGKQSDLSGKRVPFVQVGYALSAISKPMMAMFIYPLWIFFARTTDRIGKGIRTGARDAILSDEATPESKGKVFGFHRSMDTMGAVSGPVLALVYLYFFPEDYVNLFYLAFIPGILAVLTSLYLKQKRIEPQKNSSKGSIFSFLNYWKDSPPIYRKLVIGLLFFTLVNSSDVFLLLKAKEAGLDDTLIITIYIFYNLIFAIFALPMGILADRLGLKNIFIVGLVVFSIVYFGMALNNNLYIFFILFFLYGIYAAMTEGISKAWITNVISKRDTATAIGNYSGFQSICTLFSSSLTGLIWYQFGGTTAFLATSVMTLLAIIYFLGLPKPTTYKE